MASKELRNAIQEYDSYIDRKGIDETIIDCYILACNTAICNESDVEYGLQLTSKAKGMMESFVFDKTGGTLWDLEKFCFANKTNYEILMKYFSILKLEAQNRVFESYLLYLEKKREPRERFFAPKRKQFNRFGLIEAYQGLIDDKYDQLCISMPPGTGKTTLVKFFNSAVIGWYPDDYNLFFSHSGDITQMYYDGMLDIVTNTTEYTWGDIFPGLAVTKTNAKMKQFNIGSYKPFPSMQTASVGSENAGKVRASKFLLVDDMIGKLEEALNKNMLEKLWGVYTVDARQRMTVDSEDRPCKEVIQATRWSTMDPTGRIIRANDGDSRMRVVSIPALDAQTGESNFDYEFRGFTRDFFEKQREYMDEISFKCLYLQQPIEREGLVFPNDRIRRYLSLPHGEPEIITAQCDTKAKGTDYFVLPVFYKYGEDFYLVDCVCSNSPNYELQYENASNVIVNNGVQECEFERNSGGDRVAFEVDKRVQQKGWTCNITDVPTETNKEARIYQNSSWILQHIVFKDPSLYTAKEDYGEMMAILESYSVSASKQLDDVPDVLSNFAVRQVRRNRVNIVAAYDNPLRHLGFYY